MTKKCIICGKGFVAYRSYQQYCSERCRLIQNGRISKYEKNKVETKQCPVCGEPFKTNIKKKVYCSSVCYESDRKNTAYRAPVTQKTCPICGESFETTHPFKKYCSKTCYDTAQAKIKEEHRRVREHKGQ